MPLHLKGRVLFLSGLVCLCIMGCGTTKQSITDAPHPFPLSHHRAAEKLIAAAINDMDLPDGGGADVKCIVEGDEKTVEILSIVAPEILSGHTYRVVENKENAAGFRFTCDTLTITLSHVRSREQGNSIKRDARAGSLTRILPSIKSGWVKPFRS